MDSSLSPSEVAMLSHNNDDWGNSSFMWIFALLILANGGGFWGNNGYQPQYATQDFVKNGFNFNDLQDQNRDIINNITGGTAQTVAAVNQAKYDNINVAKDIQTALTAQISDVKATAASALAHQNECCCNTLRAIDGVNYANAQNTALINANTTEQIQKVLDAIQGNRMADMQNEINQLQLQNAVSGVVRYPMASTYAINNNPFCGCGCNG